MPAVACTRCPSCRARIKKGDPCLGGSSWRTSWQIRVTVRCRGFLFMRTPDLLTAACNGVTAEQCGLAQPAQSWLETCGCSTFDIQRYATGAIHETIASLFVHGTRGARHWRLS